MMKGWDLLADINVVRRLAQLVHQSSRARLLISGLQGEHSRCNGLFCVLLLLGVRNVVSLDQTLDCSFTDDIVR